MANPIHRDLLQKGVSRIIDVESLEKKLDSGKKLRIKFGIDPSGTIIHLGHAVPIMKLRAFQELDHQIVLIIGDSTAQVGDTSDKDAERPMLEREQTLANSKNYLHLIGKILDISKTEVRYNSEWMDTTSFNAVSGLAKHFSVAEMLDRHNFSKRFEAGVRISLQEFLYPLMQGLDSVKIHADVELGGNDQYFNLLAGRRLQEAFGQIKQDVMIFDLLLGPDGKKMSKTGGNCIALDMEPNAMFVKLMEVKDEFIGDYFRLSTTATLEEAAAVEKRLADGEHPKIVKLELAARIVSFYHGEQAAAEGKKYFEKVLSEGNMPSEDQMDRFTASSAEITIVNLVKELGFHATTGDARNAVSGGGVKIDGTAVSDFAAVVALSKEKGTVVQSGKKKFSLVFAP